MKKNFLAIATLIVVLSMSSCGSSTSFEKDIRKMAHMLCKEDQLNAKDQSDENVKKEQEKLEKEIDNLSTEIEKKYGDFTKDPAKQLQSQKIMMDVIAKCK